MTLIKRWTKEINKMRNGILAFGAGVNSDDPGDTFFSRNKTKVYTTALFSIMCLVFYLLNWVGLARICGIILGLQAASWVWSWLKNG